MKLASGNTRRACRSWAIAIALLLCGGLHAARAAPQASYRYFHVGDPATPVSLSKSPTRPAFVLMGGGQDVDRAFRWMIRKAGVRPGSGGRFLVLRATGTDAYDPYVYYSDSRHRTSGRVSRRWVGGASLGLSSVETLVVPSRAAANDDFVNRVVRRAQAVFIAGGDQSNYIRYWKNTRLDRSLQSLLARNVPVGGTSAGLAILGAFNFAALHGTISSSKALSDPFNRRITIDPDPLDVDGGFLSVAALADTITDSHFDRRNRMGRLIAFIARLVAPQHGKGCAGGVLPVADDAGDFPRGIGVSEQSALLVQGNASGTHFTARRIRNPGLKSDGAVYFIRPLQAPSRCKPGRSLTIRKVEVRKLADSKTVFDLSDWSGVEGYTVSVKSGSLATPQ